MKNRTVVFIIDDIYSDGGIARVNLALTQKLINENKYTIKIISLSRDNSNAKYNIPRGCEVICADIDKFMIRQDTLRASRFLKKQFKDDFDGTFVVNDVGHNIVAWLGLKHCKKAKFISWSHTNFFNGSRWGFSGWGKRLGVKKFDYLIALTKEDKKYYETILNAKNVIQIYNPIDEQIIKKKYNSESKKIVSCGSLSTVKGFDMLIEVARIVFSQIDNWTWDIYGEGPEQKDLQDMINKYNLQDKVKLKGFCNNMYEVYNEYAVFVFTSRSEGCPMTMIEALASGLPMISFDFKCGPNDLIADGVNGYIVKDWNIDIMSQKIVELVRNKNKRELFATKTDLNLEELRIQNVMKKWNAIL